MSISISGINTSAIVDDHKTYRSIVENKINSLLSPESYQLVSQASAVSQHKDFTMITPVSESNNVNRLAAFNDNSHNLLALNEKKATLSPLNTASSKAFYLDGKALQDIKLKGDSEEGIRQVAQQFEAVFIQMMLKNMRASSAVLSDQDSALSLQSGSMFQELWDNQMSIDVAKKSKLGIADMLTKQLSKSV